MKQYYTFHEIDRDLKILKLQTQIDKEEIMVSFEDTKYNLSPSTLVGNIFRSLGYKTVAFVEAVKELGHKDEVKSLNPEVKFISIENPD